MNKDNAAQYLPLVQALAEGETIQIRNPGGVWEDLISVRFDWPASDYRVKPKPREFWLWRGQVFLHAITVNDSSEVTHVREVVS